MSDRSARRLERLRKALKADRIDALLVASVTNVRYLSGFSGDASTLLVTPARALIVSDGRYATQLQEECPGLEVHIRPIGQPMAEGVAEVAGRLGLGCLAFEAAAVSVADFEALRQGLATEPLGVKGYVEALRMVKDRSELDAIRAAVACAERAFAMLRAGLRADESEKDAADALEGYLRRCGAEAASFPPIVAAGPRAALPHARPAAGARLGAADFVLVDWGAVGPGSYKSDLTRVLVTGKVSAKFEKVYRTVLAAQGRAIAAIRPGVQARDVDAEARSVIEDAGFGRFFRHGLGHGLGLDLHEAPLLRRESDVTLQPGMVLTVEPGIYLPDWGGIRIEDDVLVTPDGCEVLSHVPKALETLRDA